MGKSRLIEANKRIRDFVVGVYERIRDYVVGIYTSIEDKFVYRFLTHEGETLSEAKARLQYEQSLRH